jgi:hypothetical protein
MLITAAQYANASVKFAAGAVVGATGGFAVADGGCVGKATTWVGAGAVVGDAHAALNAISASAPIKNKIRVFILLLVDLEVGC